MGAGWQILSRVNIRHVLGHPRRTLLTAGGIAAGVGLLVAVVVVNGTLRASIDAVTRDLAGRADLEVAATEQTGLSPRVVDATRRMAQVEHAIPVLQASSRMRRAGAARSTLVFGVPPELSELFPGGLREVGSQLARLPSDRASVLLSARLADELGVDPGDLVELETPRGDVRVPVADRLARGPFADLNGGEFALMSLPAAQRVFARDARVDSVYVVGRSRIPIAELQRSLAARLAGEPAVVRPPKDASRMFQRTFDSVASLSELGGTVAIFVAVFVVLNTMSMSLSERRREIAMMTVSGAGRRSLAGAFLAEAIVLGTVAAALGTALGVLLARALVERVVRAYAVLPVTAAGPLVVTWREVVLGLGTGSLVAVLGTALPAWRILRVAPVEALRPEASYEWSRRGSGRPFLPTLPAGIAAVALAVAAVILGAGTRMWLAGAALVTALTGIALLMPWLVPPAARTVRPLFARTMGTIGRLAADALLKNQGRTSLTVGALAIAAAMVLGVGSSLDSFEAQVERSASAWYGAPLYVTAESFGTFHATQPLPSAVAEQLAAIEGVRRVYPWRYLLLNIRGRQMLLYAFPIAEAEGANDDVTRAVGVSKGALGQRLARGQILVSRLTARRHHLKPGDTIEVPTPIGWRQFRIAGLFNDLVSFDSAYIEHSVYQRLSHDDKVDRFAIVPQPGTDLPTLQARLERLVAQRGIPARVQTRDELIAVVLEITRSLFSIARAIQLVALLVAGLIVANTMATATLERRREFGLQRTFGMDRFQLRGSVLLEAAGIGVIGATIAVGLGMGIGLLMTITMRDLFAWRIGFLVPGVLVAQTVAVTVLLGVMAAFYPSRRAARTPIVETVRYE